MNWFGKLAKFILTDFNVMQVCKECGGMHDVDMLWCGKLGGDPKGYWLCKQCGDRYRDRYSKWNEWRQTQDSPYSFRNEEEKSWAWNRFRDDRFMSCSFPDEPIRTPGFPEEPTRNG